MKAQNKNSEYFFITPFDHTFSKKTGISAEHRVLSDYIKNKDFSFFLICATIGFLAALLASYILSPSTTLYKVFSASNCNSLLEKNIFRQEICKYGVDLRNESSSWQLNVQFNHAYDYNFSLSSRILHIPQRLIEKNNKNNTLKESPENLEIDVNTQLLNNMYSFMRDAVLPRWMGEEALMDRCSKANVKCYQIEYVIEVICYEKNGSIEPLWLPFNRQNIKNESKNERKDNSNSMNNSDKSNKEKITVEKVSVDRNTDVTTMVGETAKKTLESTNDAKCVLNDTKKSCVKVNKQHEYDQNNAMKVKNVHDNFEREIEHDGDTKKDKSSKSRILQNNVVVLGERKYIENVTLTDNPEKENQLHYTYNVSNPDCRSKRKSNFSDTLPLALVSGRNLLSSDYINGKTALKFKNDTEINLSSNLPTLLLSLSFDNYNNHLKYFSATSNKAMHLLLQHKKAKSRDAKFMQHVVCPLKFENGREVISVCEPILLIGNLQNYQDSYNSYQIFFKITNHTEDLLWMGDVYFDVNYKNENFVFFECIVRFIFLLLTILCFFFFFYELRKLPFPYWSSEQRWVAALLLCLVSFNDPLFIIVFINNYRALSLLGMIFKITFICALFAFWLNLFEGVYQNRKNEFTSFKIILTINLWFSFLSLFTASFYKTSKDFFPNIYHQYSQLWPFYAWLLISLLIYFGYFFYFLFCRCAQVLNLGYKLRVLYLLTFVVLILTLICFLTGSLSTIPKSAFQFTSFQALLNFYVFILAYIFTSKNNDHKPLQMKDMDEETSKIIKDLYSDIEISDNDEEEKDKLERIWKTFSKNNLNNEKKKKHTVPQQNYECFDSTLPTLAVGEIRELDIVINS